MFFLFIEFVFYFLWIVWFRSSHRSKNIVLKTGEVAEKRLPSQSEVPLAGNALFMKSYFVYVLKSIEKSRYYIGHTSNLERRISDHNKGKTRSTKAYKPWELVYFEEFESRSDAYKREMEIKSYKSGIKFHMLLERWQSG